MSSQVTAKRPLDVPPHGYPLFEVGGSYREIGQQVAQAAGDIIGRFLEVSLDFKRCVAYLRKHGRQRLHSMLAQTRVALPGPVEELEGMAEGLGIEFLELFAYNCRPEIGVISKTGGCSTLGWCKDERMALVHNEDGDASNVGFMFLLKVRPPSGVVFVNFVYPGLLPGLGPGLNSRGIVQTVNYIQPRRAFDGIPRYFISRAILESETLGQAVSLATMKDRAFPCHHTIASLREARLLSIETFPGRHHTIEVHGGHLHTNHLVHREMQVSGPHLRCVSYRSTVTRCRVLKEAIASAGSEPTRTDDMVRMLSLHEGEPYSPCVHPQGKVHAATLGTAVFEAPERAMTFYHGNPCRGYCKRYEL